MNPKSGIKSLMHGDSDSDISPEKAKVQSFITALGDNRQAFDIFKASAEKKGLNLTSPKALLH